MSFAVSARGRTHQPCAACRMLRRRCDASCILAPYFPGEAVEMFAGVHKVFGASNVIKMIQMVEESMREDAVKAIVYEARARLKDPVYGSTGAIFYLQKTVEELKMQLEWATARASDLQEQRDSLLGILMNVHQLNDFVVPIPANEPAFSGSSFSVDDTVMGCDPLNFSLKCDWSL
ncbi:LOB domain-containing protein 1-like [Malania oleifera]|uniref:LOB domain-containing protein 1-like n=1 Tax=Malania oleifera TaxID=397392 RepID=UPI0025ADC383|nr:LOB domain-containing protein 1-like [Malania oleifera]